MQSLFPKGRPSSKSLLKRLLFVPRSNYAAEPEPSANPEKPEMPEVKANALRFALKYNIKVLGPNPRQIHPALQSQHPEPSNQERHSVTACHLCLAESLLEIDDHFVRFWVSSDSRAIERDESLTVCTNCSAVQKRQSQRWHSLVEKIYSGYSLYAHSGGSEQLVFDAQAGASNTRSARILEHLQAAFPLPVHGRMLDVGCGNGATLLAASTALPHWSFSGTEIHDHYRARLESIPRVEHIHIGAPEEVPGQFELLSLIHVLEHVPHPQAFLQSLRCKLKPNGLLLIEVPDFEFNPFDLLVADHCTHFSPQLLESLLRAAGYKVLLCARNWVPKELSLVATPDSTFCPPLLPPSPASSRAMPPVAKVAGRCLNWLQRLREYAQLQAHQSAIGIFGTTLGATWLFHETDHKPAFFVDENRDCTQQPYLKRPVFHPDALPPHSRIIIGLPQPASDLVARRLQHLYPSSSFLPAPPF